MTARFTVFPDQSRREAYEVSFDDRAEITRTIVDEARADAPVLTGDYRDGIHFEIDGLRTVAVDDDEDSIYKEYGTLHSPPHADLTNAAKNHGKYSGWKPR